MASKSQDCRARNFATIIYPDSAPANWYEVLSQNFIPGLVSPLHDKDINPGGEPKKPHYHVILLYEGKKSIEQVSSVFSSICGVGCEVVQSIRGYARYLCHLDNPEKAQYSPDDVRCLCSADYNEIIGLATDKYKSIREMCEFIKSNNIVSYCEIFDYSMNNRTDWFKCLCDSGTFVVKEYIKSRQWTSDKIKNSKFDSDTGEVIMER